MKFKLLLAVILGLKFLLLAASARATPAELSVVSQDDYGIELEFRLPPLNFKAVKGPDGQTYQRFEMPTWAKTEQIGYPELPVVSTLIQIPATGEIAVEILEQTDKSEPDWVIYPVPQPLVLPSLAMPEAGKSGSITEQFVKTEAGYTATTFYPNAVATIEPRVTWGKIAMARLKIYPLQWEAATQTLRYLNYLRLRVHFSHPLPPLQPEVKGLNRRVLPGTIFGYQPRQTTTTSSSPALSNSPAPAAAWPQRYRVQVNLQTAGMYQITYEQLLTAGIPETCLTTGNLMLTWQNQPVMTQLVTQYSRGFNPGDSLIFYGKAIDSDYTDINAYQLDCWQLSRPRPASYQNKLPPQAISNVPTIDGSLTDNATPIESYQAVVRLEQNNLVDDLVKGAPQQDYWFWQKLSAPDSFDITATLSPDATATDDIPAFIRVALRGIPVSELNSQVSSNHHTKVYFNDNLVGDYTWEGTRENIQKLPLTLTALQSGDNQVRIKSPGDTESKKDQVYLNWLEFIYPRQLVANENQLRFTINTPGRLQLRVKGFRTPDIRVYDITNSNHLKEIIKTTVSTAADDSYQVTYEDVVATKKTYYVLTTDQLRPVDKLSLYLPATLKQSNRGADYILITAKELLPAVQPLVEQRQQSGLRVAVVTVEEIFEEFGFGLPTPTAIKEFLRYAYEHWQSPAPTSVLLVGDSNLDYKGYLGGKKYNFIPAYMIPTMYSIAPTDNWFVSIVGEDELPEMQIGRLPGSDVEEVKMLVDKILHYENHPQDFRRLLLVADNDSSFEEASEAVVKYIPTDLTLDKLYLGTYASDQQATADLINYFDQGVTLTHYLGHGNENVWANSTGQVLFSVTRLKELQKTDNLTFLVVLNCLNANFATPKSYSLAEEFLLTPNGGTIASFAPTSAGYLWEHQLLDGALFEMIFEVEERNFGRLITEAKIRAYGYGTSKQVLDTFVLIGDPALKLQLPVQ